MKNADTSSNGLARHALVEISVERWRFARAPENLSPETMRPATKADIRIAETLAEKKQP